MNGTSISTITPPTTTTSTFESEIEKEKQSENQYEESESFEEQSTRKMRSIAKQNLQRNYNLQNY